MAVIDLEDENGLGIILRRQPEGFDHRFGIFARVRGTHIIGKENNRPAGELRQGIVARSERERPIGHLAAERKASGPTPEQRVDEGKL